MNTLYDFKNKGGGKTYSVKIHGIHEHEMAKHLNISVGLPLSISLH